MGSVFLGFIFCDEEKDRLAFILLCTMGTDTLTSGAVIATVRYRHVHGQVRHGHVHLKRSLVIPICYVMFGRRLLT